MWCFFCRALALAPFVDRGLSWFTDKFKFESQGKVSIPGIPVNYLCCTITSILFFLTVSRLLWWSLDFVSDWLSCYFWVWQCFGPREISHLTRWTKLISEKRTHLYKDHEVVCLHLHFKRLVKHQKKNPRACLSMILIHVQHFISILFTNKTLLMIQHMYGRSTQYVHMRTEKHPANNKFIYYTLLVYAAIHPYLSLKTRRWCTCFGKDGNVVENSG